MSFPKQGTYEEFADWRDSLKAGDAVVVIDWGVPTNDAWHTVNQCVKKITPTQIVISDGRRFKRVGSCSGIGESARFCQLEKPDFVARKKSLLWIRDKVDAFPLPYLSALMAMVDIFERVTPEQSYALAGIASATLAKQDAPKEGEGS